MIDFARVQKELQECSRDMEASGIKVTPKSDNLARLTGTIPGPISSPYEGGTFQIDITLPGNILKTNTSIQGISVFVYVLEILDS
jgi:ubiquitin-conjugating enzyme (huntingtin interacting protein 2)